MIIDLDDWDKLPTQEKVYYDDTTETVTMAAGLGCIAPDEYFETTSGAYKIKEHRPGFCLSFYDGKIVWALNTAPYRKGTGDLFRVSHTQGEFVAYGSHQIFSSEYNYIRVDSLCAPPLKSTCLHSLPGSIWEHGLSAPFLGARHWIHKAQGSQYDYQSYIRFYGEQLLLALDASLGASPLLGDVHKSFRSSFREEISHLDDQEVQTQGNSHQSLSTGHLDTMDYVRLRVALAAAVEYQDFFSKCPEHTSEFFLLARQSLLTCEHHLKAREQAPSLSYNSQYRTYSTSNTTTVNSCEGIGKGDYWDLHVFGSNNYYLGGCFHHNSGKTHVLCRKLIKLSAKNRNVPGGILAPSYADYRRDIEPEMFSILEDKLGLIEKKHFTYHRTEKTWRYIWTKAPTYVFTAEKNIAGPNLGWGGINEFSMIPYERIGEFLRRVRLKDVPVKQKLLVGTPENIWGWLEEFIDKQLELNKQNSNAFRLYTGSTEENIHIDSSYTAHLRGMLDERALEVFLKGQIVRLGGDYFYYAFQPSRDISDTAQYDPNLPIGVGMDFNVGRMSATLWQKHQDRTWCFDEIVILGNSDTQQMCDALKARFPISKLILYPDASAKARKTSGRSDLEIMRAAGFEDIRFLGVNPRLRDRQLMMNGRFEKQLTKINPKCKNLIKDCKSVKQKADFTKDKTIIELTHTSDSMDYYHTTEYNFSIDRTPKTTRL